MSAGALGFASSTSSTEITSSRRQRCSSSSALVTYSSYATSAAFSVNPRRIDFWNVEISSSARKPCAVSTRVHGSDSITSDVVLAVVDLLEQLVREEVLLVDRDPDPLHRRHIDCDARVVHPEQAVLARGRRLHERDLRLRGERLRLHVEAEALA